MVVVFGKPNISEVVSVKVRETLKLGHAMCSKRYYLYSKDPSYEQCTEGNGLAFTFINGKIDQVDLVLKVLDI